MELQPTRRVSGTISVPGDKSIAHRAALISIIADEPIVVRNFPEAEDCARSLAAAQSCGVRATEEGDRLVLDPPEARSTEELTIDCGNSGTTARLLAGILAGSERQAVLVGDDSLSRRPMQRIVEPLSTMGAELVATDGHLPMTIRGRKLLPFEYRLPVASAQVKSAVLLAGCASRCSVVVREDVPTRNHTELMLAHLGADIEARTIQPVLMSDPDDPRRRRRVRQEDYRVEIRLGAGGTPLGGEIDIPGDISTAAFFFAAAALTGGTVTVTGVGLNPTRTAILQHLKAIGCEVTVTDRSTVSGEPRGTVTVRGGRLKARKVSGEQTVALIDELPVVAVLAAAADGTTVIRDAAELRVKESDRLSAIADNLKRMGVKVGVLEDGLAVEGTTSRAGADFACYGDHRIAMAFAVAALAAEGPSTLDTPEVVKVSCPEFFTLLKQVTG